MKAKLIGILIAISIIVLAIYSFVKRKEYVEKEQSAKLYPQVLKATYSKMGSIKDGEIFLGKFEPKNEATISSRISSYIIYIAKEGTRVKKGDLLVKLDNSNILSNINALNSNARALSFQKESLQENLKAFKTKYINQQKIYKRDKILYDNKAISEQALEQSQDLYVQAKAQYEGAIKQIYSIENQISALGSQANALEDDLKYATILAPFDGVVSKRYLKIGNLALPGKPLLDLEGVGNTYEVYVDVPESILPYLKVGDEATLELNGKAQEAIIETIILKAQNNMVSIKLLTKNNDINAIPDMYIKTILYKGTCDATLIPVNAVNHTSKGYYALEIINNKIHWAKFNPLARNDKYFCTKDISPNTLLGLSNRSEMLSLQESESIKVIR